MKILLLGYNGQLGSDLFKLIDGKRNLFELILPSRKELDLSQLDESYKFLKDQSFQILINCTAYNRVDDAELKNISEAFNINSHAVKLMAEVCESKKARLIHLSTDYVFDGLKSKPYQESDPPCPLNVYGSSKALGEKFAQMICSDSLIIRAASLFGIVGSSGKRGNFVETMIRLGKEKRELKIVNDITMSPTSTMDLAKMIFKLIEIEAAPGIYHAVNSGEATWYEFAKEIIEQARIDAQVIPVGSGEYPTKAVRPKYTVLNNSKITNIIGEIPHWKNALREYLMKKEYL